MKMEFELLISGNPRRAIYHPCGKDVDECREIFGNLTKQHTDFVYVPVCAEDWNSQLSPWKAPPAFGREGFAGKGTDTLRWLTEECMPAVREKCPGVEQHLIGGYSLAGLFSLWAYYETGMFQGAASCSGSLWYPGWEEYVSGRHGPKGSRIYLSLGDREEHTRNQQMQKVGERTRWQHRLLVEDPQVRETTLVWNPGGHFQQPTERLINGFDWLLEE